MSSVKGRIGSVYNEWYGMSNPVKSIHQCHKYVLKAFHKYICNSNTRFIVFDRTIWRTYLEIFGSKQKTKVTI